MSVEKKVPEIRFKEFSGEWNAVTLSNVIDVRSGKDYKHLGKGNIPVYGTGGYMLSVDSALSNDEDAIGIGRKGTIDKPYILRAPFWTVDTLFYAVPFSNFNLDFLFCLFQKIDWKKHDESTGVPSLSKVAINNVPIYATKELEQATIGNYFQKLDVLINQHQQKHDKLSNIKKAMLEKMFPKQGETVPEIRFKGFSGKWEKVTLDDYTTFRRGSFPQPYGNKEWYGGEGSMPFVQVVDVSKNLSLVEDTKQKISIKAQPRSVFVPTGSVVVTLQGTIGRVAVTQYDSFVDRTILIFESFSRITDSSFWAYTIQNKFDLEKKKAPGATIKTITKDVLASFDVLIPSTEEQTAIGNYFQKLDALINQHQQQITKLNNIKQACLSKMFV